MALKVAFFDTHSFERGYFNSENDRPYAKYEITFLETRLTRETAILAKGFPVVCAFGHDCLNAEVVTYLAQNGLKLIALRCAGYNHVDLAACATLGVKVVRVPAYSPYSVAEHALCLLLTLNRKVHRAYSRVRELNFSIEGLVGFDLHGKTVGVIGTGKIGSVFARDLAGIGCKILAHDLVKNPELVSKFAVNYCGLDQLYTQSDIISLHVPLNPTTHHIIDARAFSLMKPGLILINTGRGALIDTKALISNLKSGHLGGACLDVYEEEDDIFFHDLSETGLQDDVLARLLTFPNVLITSHQGFLTKEALANIASTTIRNISDFEAGRALENEVRA